MALTAGQQKAYDNIVTAIANKKWHVLKGYAGTGKSYLCSILSEKYPTAEFVAPTNKAAKVLRRDMKIANATTIHRVLNLKPERGKLVQREVPKLPKILFVDEASMLSTEILAFLLPHKEDTTVIFIGDPAQLPPVGEKTSPAFELGEVSELTEIVRQAADNPLVKYSLDLRTKGYTPNNVPWGATIIQAPKMGTQSLSKLIVELYKAGGVYAAWRNATVDLANSLAHKYLYPDSTERFVVGENLVLNAPFVSRITKQTLADTSDIFEITSIENMEYRGIETLLIGLRGLEEKIMTVSAKGKPAFDALKTKYSSEQRWGEYYSLLEILVPTQNDYAFTCHKLQGSTYNSIFVNAADVFTNRDVIEANKCMYVAVTRTRNKCIILN